VIERMSTGEFAARTRLSRKALRLYQEHGLLEPVAVDPRTGYRAYAPEQVHRARLIARLRLLDLPLADIATLLALAPAAAAKALDDHWQAAERTHSERRRLLRQVQDLLTGRGTPMYDIQTRDVPEQKVLSVQRNLHAAELPAFIDEAHRALYAHLEASGATADGHPFAVYHGMVTEQEDGPVEACVPFTGSVEPAGRLGVRLEPARAEAYTRLTRSQVRYPEILGAYDAVFDWITAQGHEVALTPREVYLADFAAVGDDDPACDVAVPFAAR
jgi:DNA-binding transcriptional MerR regulator